MLWICERGHPWMRGTTPIERLRWDQEDQQGMAVGEKGFLRKLFTETGPLVNISWRIHEETLPRGKTAPVGPFDAAVTKAASLRKREIMFSAVPEGIPPARGDLLLIWDSETRSFAACLMVA